MEHKDKPTARKLETIKMCDNRHLIISLEGIVKNHLNISRSIFN